MSLSCRSIIAGVIALALGVCASAQERPSAGAQRFSDAATKLIVAINADDQSAIQQLFSAGMQEFLPLEKSGPFFRNLLSAQGRLQTAGPPEVNGPTAKVRVTAAQGDWLFEITLDPSDKIAGLRVLPGDDQPGRNEAPSADEVRETEKTYFELRRSSDRTAQLTAERYFNLVRLQEWSDESGKSKVMAKYVAHDPDLTWVKLQAVRGRGADRVVKEVTVPVAKLSKVGQSRVRQIAALQKRLDELVAKASQDDETQTDFGSPMYDERGAEPTVPAFEQGREEFAESPQPQAPPRAIHSEVSDDPDPLGFAEVANTAPPQEAAAGEFVPTPGNPR